MSFPLKSQRELASTYIVQDRANQDEMTRLRTQDQMVTALMGGVLPEQPDPASLRRILDVGCGTGDWLIETAKMYPTVQELVGVDISGSMIEYARAQAEAQQVDDRVRFHVMDALRMLEFPSHSFDLVNHRMAESFVRTWEWSKLLDEYQRVARSDGIIRFTELDANISSTSPALLRLSELFIRALSLAGHTFLSTNWGNTSEIPDLLTRNGVQQVRVQERIIIFRAGTLEGQRFYEDMAKMYQTVVPFLRQWLRFPADYEEIYRQALTEMQQPDFSATWHLPTIWGRTSSRERRQRRRD